MFRLQNHFYVALMRMSHVVIVEEVLRFGVVFVMALIAEVERAKDVAVGGI